MKIAVTGASGKLGNLVIEKLLTQIDAENIIAIARNPAKVEAFRGRGINIRQADYTVPESLGPALKGADRLLLISSSELLNDRVAQHKNVIKAAIHNKVKLIVYTSVLNADQTSVSVLKEHKQTEKALRDSGIDHVILRNGWYIENFTDNISPVLSSGKLFGAAGDGKIAAASRQDFAEAAARVLLEDGHAGKIYELAGTQRFTKAELAEAISSWSQTDVEYKNLSPEDYRSTLENAGLPGPIAQFLVEADVAIASEELNGSGEDFRFLIGRPTISLDEAISAHFS